MALIVHEVDGHGWQLFKIHRDDVQYWTSGVTLLGPRHEGMPVYWLDDSGGRHPTRAKGELVGLSWLGNRIPFPPRPETTFDRRDWVDRYESQIDPDRNVWRFRCRRCRSWTRLTRPLLDAWRPE